ncbi:hypothetical protein B0H14DRAFT_2838059, partial [Mycena olivaceomarginata]
TKRTTTTRPPRTRGTSPPSPCSTGGDHVKDLLLLLLLVFYLHQIIEGPWSLYHAARPRRPV